MSTIKEAPEMAKTTMNELIYTDQREISAVKKQMKKAETDLNQFYKSVCHCVGLLKPEQVKQLPTNGKAIIRKELESRFKFPDASENFNLQSLGIDPSPVYTKYTPKKWKKYHFEFKNDGFTLLQNEMQPEIQKYFYYADSEPKQNAVKLVKDLLKLTDKLKEAGLVSQGRDAYLFDFLDYNVLTREKGIGRTPIIFNPSGCLQMLKDAGKKK